MKTHSVFPQDYLGLSRDTAIFNKQNSDTPGGAQIDETLAILQRERMIAYSKLETVRDKVKQVEQANTYQLFFKTGGQVGGDDSYFPCWFLPWASNHLTKMHIPPRIPARAGRRASLDPDLFFTAAISGCSVMAAGDPKAPIVTHGGTAMARSMPGVNEDAFEFGNSRLHWSGLFERELARTGKGGPISGVHREDYVNRAFTGTTSEAMMYEQFLKNSKLKSLRIDAMNPQGCVFGVRDPAGNWAFYLQKTITITFTKLRKKGVIGSKYVPATVQVMKAGPQGMRAEMEVDQRTASATIEVVKFYPGAGKASVTSLMPPSQLKAFLEQHVA